MSTIENLAVMMAQRPLVTIVEPAESEDSLAELSAQVRAQAFHDYKQMIADATSAWQLEESRVGLASAGFTPDQVGELEELIAKKFCPTRRD